MLLLLGHHISGIDRDSAYLTLPAGRDMTTGLLLEDTSAPGGSDDVSGPLGQLRKRLTLLQGTQVNTKSSTFRLKLLTHTHVE